jgi:DNA-binding CsgD family transcriptional regulator
MTNDLTPRELTILHLVAHGYTNREISSAIGLSEKSVEHMMGRTDTLRAIYAKIGVKNRAEAVAWYTAHFGLHHPIHPVRAADRLLELATDYVTRVYQMRISGNPRQETAS